MCIGGTFLSLIYLFSTLMISLCDKLNLTSIVINGSLNCGDTISGYLNNLPYEQTFYSFSLPSSTKETNVKLTTCDASTYAKTELYIYNSSGYRIDLPRTFPEECVIKPVATTLDQQLVAGNSYIFAIAIGPRSSYKHYTLNVYCSEPIIPPIISNQTGDYYIASLYSSKVSALQYKTIYCLSQKHCYIICDTEYGCRATTVNASKTNNVTVICNGDKTCHHLNSEIASMSKFNLQCYGSSACWGTDMNLNHVSSVYIECDGSKACSSMDIISNELGTFSMECKSEVATDSCWNNRINIKNVTHTNYKCYTRSCEHDTVNIENGINTTIECNGIYSCDHIIFNVSNNENILMIADGFESTYNSIMYAFKIDSLYIICKAQSCLNFDIYVSLQDEIYSDNDNDTVIQIDCIDHESCGDKLSIWSNYNSINNILFNCSYCWQTFIYCMQPLLINNNGATINCDINPLNSLCYENSTQLLCDYIETENEWSCSDDSCCPKINGYCAPTPAPTSTSPTVSPTPRPTRDYTDDDDGGDDGGFAAASAGGGIGGICGCCLLVLCAYFFCKGASSGSGDDYDGAVTKVTKTTYWSDGTKTKETSYKY